MGRQRARLGRRSCWPARKPCSRSGRVRWTWTSASPAPTRTGSPAALEVRAFTPQIGSPVEDPVTGSLNASLGQWLLATGRVAAPYVASQGTALGRRGRVHVSRDDDGQVWVGGATVTCVSGTVELLGLPGACTGARSVKMVFVQLK